MHIHIHNHVIITIGCSLYELAQHCITCWYTSGTRRTKFLLLYSNRRFIQTSALEPEEIKYERNRTIMTWYNNNRGRCR